MLSRAEILRRIRGGAQIQQDIAPPSGLDWPELIRSTSRRVQYDQAPPPHDEMIESDPRHTRMFRPVKQSLSHAGPTEETLGAPPEHAMTITQHAIIHEIPKKYNKQRWEVRAFLVNHLAHFDPAGFVKHLGDHFGYHASALKFSEPKEDSRKVFQYISQLQHHLHRQGDKNYDHNIMKAIADHIDKTGQEDAVLRKLENHFRNQS